MHVEQCKHICYAMEIGKDGEIGNNNRRAMTIRGPIPNRTPFMSYQHSNYKYKGWPTGIISTEINSVPHNGPR